MNISENNIYIQYKSSAIKRTTEVVFYLEQDADGCYTGKLIQNNELFFIYPENLLMM